MRATLRLSHKKAQKAHKMNQVRRATNAKGVRSEKATNAEGARSEKGYNTEGVRLEKATNAGGVR
jgi:hypothetical protein